jgi:acyl-coenzyme A synthetase/AMP-(fatty) acid ligase
MLVDGPVPGERMLRTGDWFRIDDEGLLYFVGRSDDIIKTRGEKVSPAEVENVLYGIEGVAEAAVVGMPDPVLGEAVVAYVVPRPGAEVSGREIVFRCRAMLESFMVPRDVHLVDELPKTASGKISKVGLRPA